MIYYLSRDYKYKHINDAGSKARLDIEKIMDGLSYLPAGRHYTISKNRLLHFIRTIIIVIRMLICIRKNDILILQYPTKYYNIICHLAHLRKVKVITFIHDFGCFRKMYNSIHKEIRLMNMSDAVIGCNPIICKWLLENGFIGYSKKAIVEPLHAFDFLSSATCPDRRDTWPLHKIVYAGQLARKKNNFLYNYGYHIEGYSVNVYGKGFNKSYATNPEKFNIKGFMLPDMLINKAEGDFGLVWDGDSIDCCSGNWGEYLKINTPHKVSLYIRCGLPIIIWSKAAMAEFVKKNGLGICVDSLSEINNIYKSLTQDEYKKMYENVKHISNLMANGYYFSKAIKNVISRINQD